MKACIGLFLASLFLLGAMSGAASAATVFDDTLANFRTAGVVTAGDKEFTWISDTFGAKASAIGVEIDDLDPFYTFTVDRFEDLVPRAGIFSVSYKIAISPAGLADGNVFDKVALGSDVNNLAPDVKVTKEVFSDEFTTQIANLVSLSGATPSSQSIFGYTVIWVRDTYRVDQGDASGSGILESATNNFVQTSIPEPATMSIFAVMAGLGLVGARRRRQG